MRIKLGISTEINWGKWFLTEVDVFQQFLASCAGAGSNRWHITFVFDREVSGHSEETQTEQLS